MAQLLHKIARPRFDREARRVILPSRRRPFRLQYRTVEPLWAPTGIGHGIGIPFGNGQNLGWFNAAAYDDLAMVADFNNWRFALPAWGAELAPDPTFSTPASWTIGTNWGVSGGQATHTAGASGTLSTPVSLTVGSLYELTFEIKSISAGSITARFQGGSTVDASSSPGTVGIKKAYLTAVPGNNLAGLFASTSCDAVVDNFSLREVILTRGGAALGANLVVNGDGSSVTGWTANGATLSLVSGRLTCTTTNTGDSGTYQDVATTVGRKYRFTGKVTNQASVSGARVRITDTTFSAQIVSSTIATGSTDSFVQMEFTATVATTRLALDRLAAGAVIGDVVALDDWSLQLLPNTGAFPKRAATFDEFFAFTATSTTARSYVDSTGTWKNDLAANSPRRDYRNGKQQWRLEDARTNESRYSNTLDTGAWARTQGGTGSVPVVTADFGIAPDGTQTAARVQLALNGGNTSADQSSIRQNRLLTNAVTYTHSVWMKSNTGATYVLQIVDSEGSVKSNITVTPAWQRFSITRLQTSTTGSWGFWLRGGTGSSDSADVLTWDDQLELGAFASDPIVTTTVAVTRAIEAARFSPLVEAVLQRAAATTVVRAKQDYIAASLYQRVIGYTGSASLIEVEALNTKMGAYNNTVGFEATAGSGGWLTGAGAAHTFDNSGQAICMMAGTVATTSSQPDLRTSVYLARAASTPSGSGSTGAAFAFGNYDFVGFSPERLANANLQALAVAA